jgi:hypothetical protein
MGDFAHTTHHSAPGTTHYHQKCVSKYSRNTKKLDVTRWGALHYINLRRENRLSTAAAGIAKDMASNVYPDGVENEQTSSDHLVALSQFNGFVGDAELSGNEQLPSIKLLRDGVERMWNYTAYAMDPHGFEPLHGDADITNAANRVSAAALRFARDDWTWLSSNNTRGKAPEAPPAVLFPWSGQFIMRSNWTSVSHWSWFDIGPFGGWHGHYDKLSLVIRAPGGTRLLVDWDASLTSASCRPCETTTARRVSDTMYSSWTAAVRQKGQ